MIRVDGERHTALRRLFQAEFTVPATQRRLSTLETTIARVVADAAQLDTFDVVDRVAVPVAVACTAVLLDLPEEESEALPNLWRHLHDPTFPPNRMASAERYLSDWLAAVCNAQQPSGQDLLLARVALRARREATVAQQDIINNVRLLVAASLQTVSSMIALGVPQVFARPEVFPPSAPNELLRLPATEELLRFWSVVHAGPRRVAITDTCVGGANIRAGEGVICSVPAANRDPEAYPAGDPEALDLAAGTLGHLAFGYGPHQCLGQHLARAQMALTWQELARTCSSHRITATEWQHAGGVIFGPSRVMVTRL